jgi:hypothetical protein
MTEGERATGTPNTIYDLSSVLFHALEGGASYDTYIEDAERAGDQELADFFRRVRDEDGMRADEAQRLLAERTFSTTVAPTEGLAAGAPRREEVAGAVRGERDPAAPIEPITEPGQREPDVQPVRPEEPPPPGTGVGERY